MDWLELKIDTSPAGIDPVTELLEEQGVTGVIIDDARDFKDFMAHNQAYWDYVDDALVKEKQNLSRVTFYVENSAAGYSAIAAVRIAMHALKQRHPLHRRPAAGSGARLRLRHRREVHRRGL